MLGYYTSENVLKAIENGSVSATLAVSARDIGRACVDVFLEYLTEHEVSDYVSIDVNTVTRENLEEYRENGKQEDTKS